MIAAWMLYSVAVGVLIGVAALAAERCCRVLRLPRRAVWAVAIAGTLLLSGAALLRAGSAGEATSSPTALASPVDVAASGPGAPVGAVAALLEVAAGARAVIGSSLARGYQLAATGTGQLAGSRAVLAIWVLSTALALVLLGLTLLRLSRARRTWRQHRIGGTPVLLSEDFGPAVIGLLRSVIVVPKWLLGEPPEAQQVIVQHEEEHRRAHDPLVLAAASLVAGLLAWNVALWWMLARLRLAVELDCDDRILRRGVTPLSYGSLLLEIAGRTPARLFGVTALADSRIHLERRLLAMTETNRKPGRARTLLTAAGAVLLAAAACGTEAPTSTAIEEMDVADAQKQAEESGLLRTKAAGEMPLFVVDEHVVTEAEARAIAPEDIASIEVLRKEAALGYGEAGKNGVIRMKKRGADAEQASAMERAVLARELQEPTRAQAKKKAVEAAAVAEKVARKAADARKQEVTIARARTAEGAKPAAVKEKQEVKIARTRTVEGAKLAAVKEKELAAKPVAARTNAAVAEKLEQAGAIEVRKRQAESVADEKVAAGEQLPMRRLNPFVIIDGDVSQSVTLPTLAPEEIESVTVLKGEAAIQRYGPRAAGGAIVITTKKGAGK